VSRAPPTYGFAEVGMPAKVIAKRDESLAGI
jgi:hypothetical protein